MGDDPEIRAQCQTIVWEFAETERDGIPLLSDPVIGPGPICG